MHRAERTLVLLLRISAVVLLVAIVPACMPYHWMDVIHRRLGLRELPERPIVGYLTRSLSALYAYHGALVLYMSLDVRRYAPLIRCMGAVSVFFGAGLIAIDCAVDLPLGWILCEGPLIVVLGGVLFWLAGRIAVTVHGDCPNFRGGDRPAP